MRHDVSLALGKAGPNVDVMCTDKRFGGRFMAFEKVLAQHPLSPWSLPCSHIGAAALAVCESQATIARPSRSPFAMVQVSRSCLTALCMHAHCSSP